VLRHLVISSSLLWKLFWESHEKLGHQLKNIAQLGQIVDVWYQGTEKNQLLESMSYSIWGMHNKGGVVCLTSVEEEGAHMLGES